MRSLWGAEWDNMQAMSTRVHIHDNFYISDSDII